ncbi:hypothetical protein HK102_009829 [Quaeritorhiza haematococci]|nr:hypothetical protein HK102_009829 [Quaeritorhiza haematococci]
MFGTFAIDSRRRSLYVESESDPFYRFMKRAVDSANATYRITPETPKLTFDNVKHAICLAFLIPSIKKEIDAEYLFWDDVVKGRLLSKIVPSAIASSANTNNKTALDSGSFLKSLHTVATYERELLEDPSLGQFWGGFILKNESWKQVAMSIKFPDGTSQAPRLTALTYERQRSYSIALGIFITTLVLEAAFIAVFVGIVIVRERPSVKRTGLAAIAGIVVGCMLQLASTLPGFFQERDTPAACLARDWMQPLGFAITFSTIIYLQHRIYRMIKKEAQGKEEVEMPDRMGWPYYGTIPLAFIVVLLADFFTNISGVRKEFRQVDDLTTEEWFLCDTSPAVSYVILGLEFILLCVGTFLAAEAMPSRKSNMDIQYLGLSVYNSLFVLIVVFVVQSVLTPPFRETEVRPIKDRARNQTDSSDSRY